MTGGTISDHLSPLTEEELGKLFSNFTKTAFRLEMLPTYCIAEEFEDLARFRSGQFVPAKVTDDWYKDVVEWTQSGREIIRVRIVPEPVTEYFRFEAETGYFTSIEAGEKLHLVNPEVASRLIASLPIKTDYWVFDSAIVVLMTYDQHNRFSGASRVSSANIEPFIMVARELQSLTAFATSSDLRKLLDRAEARDVK